MDKKKFAALITALMSESAKADDLMQFILFRKLSDRPKFELFFVKEDREKHFRVGSLLPNERWIDYYIDTDFHSYFRMRQGTFQELLLVITPHYPIKLQRGDGRLVNPEKALLISLFYLSRDLSMNDCADKFGVAASTVLKEINIIVEILCSVRGNFIVWPNQDECNILRRQFQDRAGFPGVIGAIDGCHINILAPANDQDSYTDRKMNHSIILQGICSATKIFTNVSVGTPGSRNDCRAMGNSSFYRKITSQGPDCLFYNSSNHLIGDKAYPCRTWLMPPYKDYGNLTALQRRYNLVHSSTRVVIEHSFGLLKGRWRRLLCVNIKDVAKASDIVLACCVLHNFCYLHNDDVIKEMVLDDRRMIMRETHLYNDENDRRLAIAKRDNIARSL